MCIWVAIEIPKVLPGTCYHRFGDSRWQLFPAGRLAPLGLDASVLPGDTTQKVATESPANKVIYFSTDGTPVSNRRTVVQAGNIRVT
jgi:hypothetical protein